MLTSTYDPRVPMFPPPRPTTQTRQVSEEVATICAMVSIGSAVFYRPKDKAVHAEAAHKNFSRGNVGDHIALMNVYTVSESVGGLVDVCVGEG